MVKTTKEYKRHETTTGELKVSFLRADQAGFNDYIVSNDNDSYELWVHLDVLMQMPLTDGPVRSDGVSCLRL